MKLTHCFFSKTIFSILILGGAHASLLSPLSYAENLKVTLFGQPCTLTGPVPIATLNTLHQISPANCKALDPQSAKRSLGIVESTKEIPNELRNYHGLLAQHLKARVAFYSALEVAQKKRSAQQFITRVRSLLRSPNLGKLQRLVEATWTPEKSEVAESDLLDYYDQITTSYPESEYHAGIRRMNVRYQCSFDESTEELREHEEGEEGDEDETPEPQPETPQQKSQQPAPKRRPKNST